MVTLLSLFKPLCDWFCCANRLTSVWNIQDLISWLMSLDATSIFSDDVLLSWCHLFFEVPVPPPAKHPHNLMLPSPYFTVVRIFQAGKLSPLSSKCDEGSAKHFSFKFIRPYDMSPKNKVFLIRLRL